MSVQYNVTVKNARMNAVLAAIDAQSSPGYLEIGTSGMATVLATITFQKPSFSQSGGVLTAAGVPISATASATGNAANADIKDGSGTVVVSGLTVGTTGTDIIINSTSITASQTCTLTSASITHS